MLIGVPRESRPGETRVAATPKTVEQLLKLGYQVAVEAGAGAAASFDDAAYAAAGATVAHALRAAAGLDVDVVALVRGGGARSDLAAFDSELIARAIAHLPAPVLTGIGHETDDSVADAVAHTRYKTPTACAAGVL